MMDYRWNISVTYFPPANHARSMVVENINRLEGNLKIF